MRVCVCAKEKKTSELELEENIAEVRTVVEKPMKQSQKSERCVPAYPLTNDRVTPANYVELFIPQMRHKKDRRREGGATRRE